MGSSIVGLLDLGRNALLTHQKSIHTAGHNIANVNTPGYSRQRVNLAANQAFSGAPGQIGTGVTAMEIQRIYDRLVEGQINSEQQSLGRWEAREYALERVEMIFDEIGGEGLAQALNDFWNTWQYLTDNPEGYTERATLLSQSEFLATSFNQMAAGLVRQQVELDFSIAGAVEEINQIASQLADLNRKIGEIEMSGQNANDLRDQQALLLKDLAARIDFDTFEDDHGRVSVLVGEGRPLVQGYHASQLTTQTNAQGHLDIYWTDGGGNSFDITPQTGGGRLGGWLQTRDVEIADYLGRLDALAQNLISEVNALHTAGFDLQAVAGEVFFTGTSAADMALNSTVASDPNRIAAAASAAGVPGDGGNALAIAGLQHTLTMGGGTATFDDYYRALVTDVGSAVRAATTHHNHQKAVTTSLENFRESISGVSLEEEMVNLVKFQHAFDAAAKLVATVDEMIDTVMNITR